MQLVAVTAPDVAAPDAPQTLWGKRYPEELTDGIYCFLCGVAAAGETDQQAHAADMGHDDWLVVVGPPGQYQVRTRHKGTERPWKLAPEQQLAVDDVLAMMAKGDLA